MTFAELSGLMTGMRLSTWQRTTLLAGAAALAWAGGCSKDSTSSPSDPPPGGTTVTITAIGASPRTLTVPQGTQITFINNDTVPHEMYSNPHP